jgi:hypothetical protein
MNSSEDRLHVIKRQASGPQQKIGRGFTRIHADRTRKKISDKSLDSVQNLFCSDLRLTSKLSQHLANLFVMPLFVIANKGNSGDAVNLAKERMFENDVPETIIPVRCA